jgi:hypothetical protein
MAIVSPPVLGPAYDDVGERVEKLAAAFTRSTGEQGVVVPGWVPPPAGEMDAGRALIRVFERMARHASERINRVPERTFLAFLDRTGVAPAEACAARVPLTFSLVARGDAEPVVPGGTRVGALPLPGDARELAGRFAPSSAPPSEARVPPPVDPREVVFESERDLFTTRAKLAAAFVRQPSGDRLADRSAAATGAAAGFYEAFDGGDPAPHFLYAAADSVLGAPAGSTATVTFGLAAADVARWQALHSKSPAPALSADAYYSDHVPAPPLVAWTYWNGSLWAPLPLDPAPNPLPNPPSLSFKIPADLAAVAVNGRTARWLRGQLLAWPLAGVPGLTGMQMSAVVQASGLAPSAALAGGQPVDLSLDFYPFGEQPRLNNHVLLACDAALSRPGASVTAQVTLNAGSKDLKAADVPVIAWEISTRTGWIKVAETKPTKTTEPIPNDVLRTTTFVVPADAAAQTIGGTKAVWLRIRLSGGSFGSGVSIVAGAAPSIKDDGYRPPIVTSVTLAASLTVTSPSPLLATQDDLAFADRSVQVPFAPFSRSTDAAPSLYLGFDRAFAPRSTLLYFQVAPLDPVNAAKDAATAGGTVAWDYWTAAGSWAPLACEDETRSFTAGGLVSFVAPADLGRRALFGRDLFWLRMRLLLPPGLAASPPPSPRLGRVLTNTVWGRDAAAFRAEVLGSGDGRKGQSLAFANQPVLAGQRVEVREAVAPAGAERAAIVALEGADAISGESDPLFPGEVAVRWHEVTDFYTSGPRDRHYTLDRSTGSLRFGDGRRGMPPPKGVNNVRAAAYFTGGGAVGNRPARTVTQLKTTVPYVDGVTNHEPASGGADRETLDDIKAWGPSILRHGHRAVTAEDFEDLAFEASTAVARARVIAPSFDAVLLANTPAAAIAPRDGVPLPGGVVLLVAATGSDLPPSPSAGLLRDVDAYVRARSGPAVALRVAGPSWIEVRVDKLTVTASSASGLEALRARVERALREFFHPITGGMAGEGWEFGELPHESDVYRLVSGVAGVDRVGALTWTLLSPDGKPPPASTDPVLGRALIYPGRQQVEVLPPGGL